MHKIVLDFKEMPMGHRLVGHEGGCKNLHGHNYNLRLTAVSEKLDKLGMVCDFGDLKILRDYMDDKYDHAMCLWHADPLVRIFAPLATKLVIVPFNPTAENLARHWLVELREHWDAIKGNEHYKVELFSLEVFETSNASALAT